jgi:hypothetical protein
MNRTIPRRDFLRSTSALGGLGLVATVPLASALTACKDKEKDLIAALGPGLAELLPLTERDTKQVRDGLPKAAEVIVKHIDIDPGADAEGLKRALTRTREEVKDLAFSKVTFFAFMGPDGTVLRSEADTDLALGNSLTKAIPDTAKVLEAGAKPMETFGFMEGLRGVNQGNQLQWVVCAPVIHEGGKLVGALVGGWSLRLYAKYLDEHFKQALEKKKEDPQKPNPLSYLYIVKGKLGYGGPDAPDVNATALGDLDLASKVKGEELFQMALEVESRSFVIGARKAPALGDDIYLAAMLSAV